MEPGTLLAGRYRIERVLASGGMGVVYSARQQPLDNPVALKVLRREHLKHGPFLERLRREARIAASLKHPNIVAVTDLVLEADLAFLVMEYLDGESFGALISRSTNLPWRRIAMIGRDVLLALDAAHSADLVHRDVKPDNIFLARLTGGLESVKLLDFGLVKVSDPQDSEKLTASNSVLGTWQYMAPEQARGDEADARADVYALGACLYYALTKKRPYQAADMEAAMFAMSNVPAPPLNKLRPDVPAGLGHIIDRALDKGLVHRFQSAREMLEAIKPWAEESEGAEHPVSSDSRYELSTGRRINAISLAIEAAVGAPSSFSSGDGPDTVSRELPAPSTRLDPRRRPEAFEPTVDVGEHEQNTPIESGEHIESVELVSVPSSRSDWRPPQKVRTQVLEEPGSEPPFVARRRPWAGVPRIGLILFAGFLVFATGVALGQLLFK
jgi:serine/threonine-protein kinase